MACWKKRVVYGVVCHHAETTRKVKYTTHLRSTGR